LLYQGTPLPKKMNKLRAAGHPVPGSLLRPDPAEETAALERAWAEDAKRDAEREQRALSAGATEQHAH
jgi:ubiquinol-cytochrome c reductase cytochrome b subunit